VWRWLAPGALAAVFAFAAGAKLADRQGTEAGFAALGVPSPRLAAGLTSGAELATAIALIVAPPVGAVLGLALLAGFSTLLAGNLARGRRATCRCFGELSNRPISWRDLARNGVLAVLALVTLAWPPT